MAKKPKEEKTDEVTVVPVVTDVVPTFAITVEENRRRIEMVQQFVQTQMKKGEDYGEIPGVSKPSLLKPGAEKLCNIFGFAVKVDCVSKIEDWDKPMFMYTYKAQIINKRNNLLEAECEGSCNSKEVKYAYRKGERTCPDCGKATIIKGRAEFGGGWVCFTKKGGCGSKYRDGDRTIESQQVGRVANEDVFDQVNTIQKMAQKRAIVGAVLIATRASGFMTQDVEDMSSFASSEKVIEVSVEPEIVLPKANDTVIRGGTAKRVQLNTIAQLVAQLGHKFKTKAECDKIVLELTDLKVSDGELDEIIGRLELRIKQQK